MAEQNKEWSLQLNVSGEQFFKPGTFDKLPDGGYECIVQSSWREASNSKSEDGSPKADNIVFELKVAKGPEAGKVVRKYKPAVEGDAGSVTRKEWKNLLATVVKDPASLEGGAKTIKAGFFAGKTVFIAVQNPPEGTKTAQGKAAYANINFITKDMVAEFSKAKAGNPTANGASAPGAAKTFEVQGSSTPQPGGEPAADPLE